MLVANIAHRVFHIRVGDSLGSAFTIDVKNKEYLITAKHMVGTMQGQVSIDLYRRGQWHPTSATILPSANSQADVAVLTLGFTLTPPNLPVQPTGDGMIIGQDVYFVGFPYGLTWLRWGTEEYPLGLVKKATVSGLLRDESNESMYVLDGHNNPGFSGGPVFFQADDERWHIAAVILGYTAVPQPLFHQNTPTELYIEYNTGIIRAYHIERALEIIKAVKGA